MNTAKASKNSIANRGAKSVLLCTTCGQERRPLRVLAGGRSRMAYECKCGLLDKAGNKV